ncbi:hypothetical protein B0H15DRAFT_954636 [Mycena belliarum]|uniref:Uncharacterized protein n=1 Tax=Mycena belliarum TaxID=1033014 RepID=A0AAD6XGX9_9AGAR|nr:hypothetical protein B0H15DRAFT_954636 [Mycena belliae]
MAPWVCSKKKVYYVRPPAGSRWMGPSDDRVWVPGLDWPDGLEPPPDDDADGDVSMAPPTTPQSFGTIPAAAPVPQTAPVAVPPAVDTRANAPARHTAPTTASGPPRGPPATVGGPPDAARGPNRPPQQHYGPFTGAFANTMRYRDAVSRRMHEGRGASDLAPTLAADRQAPPRSDHYEPRDREDTRGRTEGHHHEGRQQGGRRPDVRNEYVRALDNEDRREGQRAEALLHQDRAREQALRAKASATRPGGTTTGPAQRPPAIIRPPPDVDTARLDADGLPMLPGVAIPDDESDYGGSSDDDEEDELRNLKNFRTKEEFRLSAALRRPDQRDAPPMPPAPASTGVWATISYSTIVEARALNRWIVRGCPRAHAMWEHLMRYFSHNPTARRSDGIQYLMREQARTDQGWLLATTGDATPRSRRGTSPNRNQRRRRPLAYKGKRRSTTSGTTTTSGASNADVDDPMPPAPPTPAPPPFAPSYAGRAPFAVTPIPARVDSSGSLHDAIRNLTERRPAEWARGLRLEDGTWPTEDTPIGARPLVEDVLASRFFQFVAPRRAETSQERAIFMEHALLGFSLPGFFERFAFRGGWQYAEMPLEQFLFLAPNLTMSQTLAWVLLHGIQPGSRAALMLQSYAASWRNLRDGNPDPQGQQFSAFPRNIQDVLSVPDSAITNWRDLSYGPVRVGVQSNAPRFPGNGLTESMHAPTITPALDEEMPPATTLAPPEAPVAPSSAAPPDEPVTGDAGEPTDTADVPLPESREGSQEPGDDGSVTPKVDSESAKADSPPPA